MKVGAGFSWKETMKDKPLVKKKVTVIESKSKLKEFFKPDWKKIILLIIFLIFVFFHVEICSPWGAAGICEARGSPLPLYICQTKVGPGANASLGCSLSYGLIIDLIFWYSISCSLIFIYDKLRGKK